MAILGAIYSLCIIQNTNYFPRYYTVSILIKIKTPLIYEILSKFLLLKHVMIYRTSLLYQSQYKHKENVFITFYCVGLTKKYLGFKYKQM